MVAISGPGMYIPPHFVFDDDDEIQELIRRWPLATVVVHGSDGLAANHIPLIIDQEQAGLILHGHIARANKLSRIDDATSALAVFEGPSAYISPSWYAPKRHDGKVVPTWNYSARPPAPHVRNV
jgi:transcriptional regulator